MACSNRNIPVLGFTRGWKESPINLFLFTFVTMKTTAHNQAWAALAWLLAVTTISCTDSHRTKDEIESRMEEIKLAGDTAPEVALLAFDSLQGDVASLSQYTRNKYALLGIRLRDKAYILPTSDSCICELVPYFEKQGTNRDKQEAYYYAGSVYRDLQDTPRSLEYFLKSAACPETGEVDSLMLRNCYSQLCGLYFNVQDYKNSLLAARKECEVAKGIGILDDISLMHQVNSYMQMDRHAEASHLAHKILTRQSKLPQGKRSPGLLSDLLLTFCIAHDAKSARMCYSLLPTTALNYKNRGMGTISLGRYFQILGKPDSTVHYYQIALEHGDSYHKYDASKNLFHLYDSLGNKDQALKYAREHISISAELDLGKRQELAATANNLYQYYRDKEKQDALNEENRQARVRLLLFLTLGIAFASAVLKLHVVRKYRRVKYLQSISSAQHGGGGGRELPRKEQELMEQIREKAEDRKRENEELKANLATAEQERQQKETLLDTQMQDLQRMRGALRSLETAIEEKKAEVKRLAEVNVILSRKAHQTRMAVCHGDIMSRVDQALNGSYAMTEEDWNQFMAAIDQEYPQLSMRIADTLGDLKKGQERVCYLLMAGFTPRQATVLIGTYSRSTIMRWCKEYRERLQDLRPRDE